jgi:hypothetical protein
MLLQQRQGRQEPRPNIPRPLRRVFGEMGQRGVDLPGGE